MKPICVALMDAHNRNHPTASPCWENLPADVKRQWVAKAVSEYLRIYAKQISKGLFGGESETAN